MQAACSFETLISICKTIRYHHPEGHSPNNQSHEILKRITDDKLYNTSISSTENYRFYFETFAADRFLRRISFLLSLKKHFSWLLQESLVYLYFSWLLPSNKMNSHRLHVVVFESYDQNCYLTIGITAYSQSRIFLH
jgi:hypothetical protein